MSVCTSFGTRRRHSHTHLYYSDSFIHYIDRYMDPSDDAAVRRRQMCYLGPNHCTNYHTVLFFHENQADKKHLSVLPSVAIRAGCDTIAVPIGQINNNSSFSLKERFRIQSISAHFHHRATLHSQAHTHDLNSNHLY